MLGQSMAWRVYDRWLQEGAASFLEEPPELETIFRSLARADTAAPKDWADSYLAAFATAADLQLVTFDSGFRGRMKRLVFLKP